MRRMQPRFRDAHIAMTLYDLRREATLRAARELVGSHFQGATGAELQEFFEYGHPQNALLRQVVGYWEMAAGFVVRGIFHPDVYLDTCDEGIYTFAVFEPHLEVIRRRRPDFLRKTERAIAAHAPLAERLERIRARIRPPAG